MNSTTRNLYETLKDFLVQEMLEQSTKSTNAPTPAERVAHTGAANQSEKILRKLVSLIPGNDADALNRYNAKWAESFRHVQTTRDLYNAAILGETPEYGNALQEHVLALLGSDSAKEIPGTLRSSAQAWVIWMLRDDPC